MSIWMDDIKSSTSTAGGRGTGRGRHGTGLTVPRLGTASIGMDRSAPMVEDVPADS